MESQELQRVVRCNDCNWLGKLQDTDNYKGLWHCPDCGSTELRYNDGPLPVDFERERLLRKAAPAMYEALKMLLRDYSTNPLNDDFYDACLNARQALAKAEGK